MYVLDINKTLLPNWLSKGSRGDIDIENRLMDKGWREEGDSEINGESEMHRSIFTNICKIDRSGNLLYDSGNSDWGL